MINRREFAVGAGVVSIAPAVLITGCSVNIKALLNTVLDAAAAVIRVAEPNAPWLPELTAAIAALKQAEASWQSGAPADVVIAALNTVEAVLAVIPMTAKYSALIDVLVAGIEAVLAALSPNQGATSPHLAMNPNVHRNRVALKKPHIFQSEVGAFKQQWNEVVSSNPQLASAKLQ
jgi:hypothetical protein